MSARWYPTTLHLTASFAGDVRAISESQKRGWELFKGKARCITCHEVRPSFPLFTDFKFHNTGIATKNIDLDELAERVLKKAQAGATSEVDANVLAHALGFCESLKISSFVSA